MTKKILVAYDPNKPEKQSSDFLAVYKNNSNEFNLKSLKNNVSVKYGLVVFTGRNITSNDLFAKVIDSGQKINSVDEILNELNRYLDQIKLLKIGDIVFLNKDGSLEKLI